MKPLHRLKFMLSTAAANAVVGIALMAARTASATPFASCVTNSNGTIYFQLNEGGGNVTVTFANGKASPSFDGLTTGTNLGVGQYSFVLGTNASYTISVAKTGTGIARVVDHSTINGVANPNGTTNELFVLGSLRGIDINKNVKSPNFGQIYFERYGAAGNANLYELSADGAFVSSNSAGVTWQGTSSPYRMSVANDDSLLVGDYSSAGAAIWRVAPNLTSAQLMLGPVGDTAATAAGVHGEVFSRPIMSGSISNGTASLYEIDGDFPSTAANSILIYSNLSLAALPWENPPSAIGAQVGLNIAYLSNVYPGLTQGPNGYFYASEYRNNWTIPDVYVFDDTATNLLWSSLPAGNVGTGPDYFVNTSTGDPDGALGLVDSAVSPDGKYFVGLSIDNHMTVVSLTNGIPDVSTLYTIAPTSYAENGRGICWDAADNIYMISSGTAWVQEWTLGLTATAVTTGNASGVTGFSVQVPAAAVTVTASTPQASQTGPTPGVFTITLNAAQPTPTTINLTLGGTAVNGKTYTLSPAITTNFTIAAGMISTNIIVTPTAGGSLPTTTVVLTVLGGSTAYSVGTPNFATVSIQNTGPQTLAITKVLSPTIYKGLTNDPGYFVVTRYGDTNAATYYASGFTYGGTATPNEFVPAQTMEFDPGTTAVTNYITPLIDTTAYVGTKTVTISLASGPGYASTTNLATIAILDNQYPPAPVIYQDSLSSSNDVVNWSVNSANDDMPSHFIDDTVQFGYSLTNTATSDFADNGIIPLPPSGATSVLRVTVNKTSAQGSGAASGVNLYLTNVYLAGDYAVRFSMDIVEGDQASYTTEGSIFGINHTGNDTNWWSGSTLAGSLSSWASDGEWYWVSVDGGASLGSYIAFTGVSGSNGVADTGWNIVDSQTSVPFDSVFENPVPYSTSGGPGLVGNSSPDNAYYNGAGYTNGWADVEIRTVHNVVTMSINKTVIYSYTNTTTWTNGYVMLGYEDPFDSVGGLDGAVYYSGLTVVSLAGGPSITKIAMSAANTVTITFATQVPGLTPSAFTVQDAATLAGGFSTAAGVTITQTGPDTFQAVVPAVGSAEFFRVEEQ